MSLAALLLVLTGPSWAQRAPYSAQRLSLQREVTEVALAPAGAEAAYITDTTGALEVWTTPASGGAPSQVSSLGEQASGLQYSPDGQKLVFTSDFGGDERTDLYLVDAGGGEVENLTSSTQAESGPRFSPDGAKLAFTSDPGQSFLFQLMVMDLATRGVRQLTSEKMNLHFPVWSGDGATIAATRSGDDVTGDLLLIDVLSGAKREIPAPGAAGMMIAEAFIDAQTLLCRARNEAGFLQLYWLDTASGQGRFIGPGNWDVDGAKWRKKIGIILHQNQGGLSALWKMAGPDAQAAALLPAQGRIEDFDVDAAGAKLAYLWSDSAHPADVWTLELKTGKKAPATRSLLAGLKPETLSTGRMIRYSSFDGKSVSALYLPPAAPRLGSPPPLVVIPHGGPDWQTYDDFSPMRQALAEAGFAVLAPNFRGSTGFGRDFLESNRKDWGGGDLKDLVAGVRFLSIRQEADPSRVGITGASYGGYLTLMALAKTPGVWAAGAESYGMPDLVQDYELTKDRFGDWYETQMGNPQTQAALFHDRSAIHFLDAIKAPLLIFQGANDTNVPLAESELVYQELKKRGRPVELVVYPDEGHGFTKRKNKTDYVRRTVDFFTRVLGGGR